MLNSLRKTKIKPITTKPIILTGGLNEELSNLERDGGELSDVLNYVEVDGGVEGYVSVKGYERYDGQTAPSTVGVTIDPDTGDVTDDTARESARTDIDPIPGSGDTLGVLLYNEVLYGFRNNAGATACEMYKATASGWSLITSATMNAGGSVKGVSARFSDYKSNEEVMVWVDGVSDIHTYDGTTVVTITHGSLPPTDKPTHVGVWHNRLFLAYPGGHIFFSIIGDPTDFTALSGAGEVHTGDDVTGFIVTPGGSLLITMKDEIRVLQDMTGQDPTSPFDFAMDTFSPISGAIDGTVQRMLGTIYFADDRGVTTLEQSAEYGDFSANSLAKKVEKTYQQQKQNIVLSITNRQDNQYILFYNETDGAAGLVFSFSGKRLKGVTKIKFAHQIHNSVEGKDSNRNDVVFVGSDGGYVYQLFSGTSFDGGVIQTHFGTAFHHYGSPGKWKHFKEISFEASGDAYTTIYYRTDFEYNQRYYPQTQADSDQTRADFGVWGSGVWGVFIWGENALTILKDRIMGYGANMRAYIYTDSKYKQPHSVHNMVVKYTTGSIQN